MRRGPKPARSKEAKPPAARKRPKEEGTRGRDLEKQLAESLEREKATGRALTEALEQQTATSDVLRVISQSQTDIQPVFDALIESATRLCVADIGAISRLEGDILRLVLHSGMSAEVRSFWDENPPPLARSSVTGRAALERRTMHVPDILADSSYDYASAASPLRKGQAVTGYRAALVTPMLRDGAVIGTIAMLRREAGPFTESQIKLLETFADQAVIAIENVRLFTELEARNRDLTTALDQRTATAEILRVISSSPTDVQPTFDAIAENATRLCRGVSALVTRFDGELIHGVAYHDIGDAKFDAVRSVLPIRPGRGSLTGRAIESCRVVHIEDLTQDPEFEHTQVAQAGFRTGLAVPMLREGVPIGTITLSRMVVAPFTPGEIALLQTFADQAVIAIENVRLFNETKEALERQTATADILRVIANSPTDLQPVLDAVAERAARLCGANDAVIFSVDGNVRRQVAHFGSIPIAVAPEQRLGRGFASGRAILEARTIHIHDVLEEMARTDYEPPDLQRDINFRTVLATPLVREDRVIGAITIRRTEVRPFTDTQIALLKAFADQAVIAIENVRLFKELEARNRDLTATSEILRVISRSPMDIQPVLETIAQNASRVCGASDTVVYLVEGDQMVRAAHRGPVPVTESSLGLPIERDYVSGLAVVECRTVHVEDVLASQEFPRGRAFAERSGFHTVVAVPLVKSGAAIGTLAVRRTEVQAFSSEQIALLETFAAQAVIAIENVRLFKQLQTSNRDLTTALDKQIATSEILGVISRSQTDIQPVFNAILESSVRLLGGYTGLLTRIEGDQIELAALTGTEAVADAAVRATFPRSLHSTDGYARAVRTGEPLNIADTHTDLRWPEDWRATARVRGYRSAVVVPLLRQGEAIGAIAVSRREPGGFTDDEIALLQTFASQAVIAIENVRLFNETKEALERQTATAEILRVISQSQTELQPVFDAIVDNAMRLFRAWSASVLRLDGELMHLIAMRGGLPGSEEYMRRQQSPRSIYSVTPAGRCVATRAVVHIQDVESDPALDEPIRDMARTRGWKSELLAPMLRDGQPIGVIAVTRAGAGAFSAAEIELLQTFADQAVIAVENARLLTELQARTAELSRSVEQLTALGEVGRAVSSSLDLDTVLNTIVARAIQLAGARSGTIWEYDAAAEEFVLRITQNVEDPELLARRDVRVRRGEGAVGQLAVSHRPVQIPDITNTGAYEGRLRNALVGAGTRALLAIPLLHEDRLLGGLVMSRTTPGEFPPEAVDLLATFATQSALAIQNARLFLEIEDKSRQLEAASHHKSEFLANMSHELRTPLNAVIGFSEVLKDRMFGDLNEKQEEYLKDIHASGQHLLSLINDILDLSKIEAGRMELELSDFHLPTALDSALTLVRERAGRRSIALHTNIDDRLGQIQADERKVRQVVLNLLSNAIKFTPEGGRIDVGAVPKDGFVEVSVRDTGVGIAPEDQEAVFEEFRQVGTADKKVEGTGLGLTLCRKFVELHGGRIWVKSEVGVGSTFTFSLPLSNS